MDFLYVWLIMKSVAFYHFPRVVAGTNRFLLFNPILKKRYKNRPEERVRLKWVEYILHQTQWKKSRIGFETPVKVPQEKNTLRADLILYTEGMEPSVLIECKSDSLKLNQSAAEQAARYNSDIKAKYIVLTNGIEDYWFKKDDGDVRLTNHIFEEDSSFTEKEKDLDYWQKRGFCSSRTDSNIADWLESALNNFWQSDVGGTLRYLDFKKTVLSVPMNQYYKVFEMNSGRRLAVSFIGFGRSDNYIIAVLNSQGANQGILTVNLDKLQDQQRGSMMLMKGNKKKVDVTGRRLTIDLTNFDAKQIKNLPHSFMKFFV